MFEHYVYVYLNPLKKGDFKYGKFEFEYEPFYIGMGKKDRIDRHISYAISKMKVFNPLKNNIILKILKNGIEPIRYKLYENLSIETAKRIEKILIRLIGRRDIGFGTLANHTNGGDETPFYGKRHIEESIEKMRMTIGKSRKGKLNANFGNYWSDEQKNKASKKAKELGFLVGEKNPMLNEECRKKVSESKMGLKNPNGFLWELVSPTNEKFKIEGGMRHKLKYYGLNEQQFRNCEIVDGYRINKVKKGWKLKKLIF